MPNQQEEETPTDITACKAKIEWLWSWLENLSKPTGTNVIKHFFFHTVWIP